MPAYTGTGGRSRLAPPFSGAISSGEGFAEPRLHRRADAYFPGTHGGQVVGEPDGETDDLHQLPRPFRRGGAVRKKRREVEEPRHIVRWHPACVLRKDRSLAPPPPLPGGHDARRPAP